MNFDNITIGELKNLQNTFSSQRTSEDHGAWVIGGNYFVRTVTHIVTGKLVAYTSQELVLMDAAWIPQTERYADTIAKGVYKEVEPYPEGQKVIVGRGAIIDATTISTLPRTQK